MSTNQYISIREMLDYMQSGQPFSIKYVTYDRQRKTGGKIKEHDEAELLTVPDSETNEGVLGAATTQRPRTVHEHNLQTISRLKSETSRKANHKMHYTRNIRVLQEGNPTSEIRKIHPPLVLEFNSQIVTP